MVGLSYGHLIGGHVPLDTPRGRYFGAGLERINAEAGVFDLPGSAPPPNPCNARDPRVPYSCSAFPATAGSNEWVSFHAKTLPGAYLLPALLSRMGRTTTGKLYLGRLGFLLENTVLFVVAVVAARPLRLARRPLVLAGLLLSATPLTLFLVAQLAPSGTETIGYVAFTTALLRAVTHPSNRWWWMAAGTAALVAWTSDLALILLPALAALVVAFNWSAWRVVLGDLRRRVVIGGLSVAVISGAGAFAWRAALQYPLRWPELSTSELSRGVRSLRVLAMDSVGRVGWRDVKPGLLVVFVWLLPLVTIVGWLCVRSRRWLAVAVAYALLWGLLNMWLTITLAGLGYANSARYTIALVAAMLVVGAAGTHVHERSRRLERAVLVAVGFLTAVIHFSVLVLNAQRHANGLNEKPISFSSTTWQPPLGWPFALVLMTLACGSVAALPLFWSTSRSELRTARKSPRGLKRPHA